MSDFAFNGQIKKLTNITPQINCTLIWSHCPAIYDLIVFKCLKLSQQYCSDDIIAFLD